MTYIKFQPPCDPHPKWVSSKIWLRLNNTNSFSPFPQLLKLLDLQLKIKFTHQSYYLDQFRLKTHFYKDTKISIKSSTYPNKGKNNNNQASEIEEKR